MTDPSDRALQRCLTGLCTFLVQPPSFSAGDEVFLTCRVLDNFGRDVDVGDGTVGECPDRDTEGVREGVDAGDGIALESVIPLRATASGARNASLAPGERSWGETVVLVRATLAATGGRPRDSLNQPTGEYDPNALTLSNVRVVDRSPSWDGES